MPLLSVMTHLNTLTDAATVFSKNLSSDKTSEIFWWAKALALQCLEARDELFWLAPWTDLPAITADLDKIACWDITLTLKDLLNCETMVGNISNPDISKRLHQAAFRATHRISVIKSLIQQSTDMAMVDYNFLYDKNKRLFAIGYHVADHRCDTGYYDLLASEARLASFVAIAQGQLPQENWFALGRQLRTGGGNPILVSWSGSMFEYLMPLLVMPNFDQTLLDQTYKAAVKCQIDYGNRNNIPWGVSESGYYMFDTHLNYQYRAFGVPCLGLKRDLADDVVIAPYASAMALMVAPEEACKNLQRLTAEGFEGRYGHYEAIDYTPDRLSRGKSCAIVRSFMAHHQGMSFLSLSYLLLDQPMQARFLSDPQFQATMLLLHEKIPRAVAFYSDGSEYETIDIIRSNAPQTSIRIFNTAATPLPDVNLLSNGRYHVMLTNAGGSSSRWKDFAVTRWHEDSTRDHWGAFCYVRDVASDDFWSTTFQPTLKVPDYYEVIFSEGRAEFHRRDGDFDMHTEIVVSSEDDIEVRRSRITNLSGKSHTIEITSYAEVVLAPTAADAAHPAFSNLFVQTEILYQHKAILCTRRARSFEEQPPWMFHQMAVHGAIINQVSYETDRMRFIGRGQTVAAPHAMLHHAPLSGTHGSVLDPVVAIRTRIMLAPEQTVTIDIITGASDNRADCAAMVDKYEDSNLTGRAFELAGTHAQVILRQLNATEADAQLYGRIASAVIYPNASLRADAAVIIKNCRGQSSLWSYAISGDLPIVLLQIKDIANINLVRQMVQAHAYWRLKGLAVDLVIWNEDNAGYRQVLQDQILGLIAAGIEAHVIDRPGGIFVRPGDQISYEDRILLESVANVIIADDKGTLEEQISRPPTKTPRMARLFPVPVNRFQTLATQSLKPRKDLILFNGLGGFTPDGREYVIMSGPDHTTPAPWSNVLANADFGTVISERGQSYTWSENAHEYRLSPWNNDPVGDTGGEAFYIRDEESGVFWSPTPGPCVSKLPYITRHGFGYSVFEHIANGIHSELTVFVAIDTAVKFSVLKIRNISGRSRKISAT
ncbi:MAG: glucoamylase family protein, partial [Pseudomonadota bacterium]